ncbi:xylulokinase [uncultured Roseobacter sp.]|uniref:xylulokinase n=1 Tax=uncultured Roseobacter sp. TaxID=114847 RepID=UPI00261DA5E4|nr:xylulokinase [uncultured Roseobacter sp.]
MSYLGIDLGTSGLRALLLSEDGAVIGVAEQSYTSQHARPGWSEQDPAQWTDALDAAASDLRSRFPAFADLKGVGVAGHMHGATLIDPAGTVIRPCILWNDTRSHAEAKYLDQCDHVRAMSCNIVFPGFTAPKLLWVKHHEPENFARVAKVLLPAAFLGFYLTGDFVADMSDSAGTSWLDVRARDWSPELLAAGDMRADQMPRLVEGSHAAGTLRPEIAKRWGVGEDAIVAAGAGDNAAAACGIGALNDGEAFLSLGTSGVLLAARDTCRPAPASALHTFCHAVPDRWYQMGVMLSATDSLNWLASITGSSAPALTQALGDDLRPPGGTMFLPYLSGERTPHNDADIRGSFTGLAVGTDVADLTRAVLEGVAFGLRDSLEAFEATGTELTRLIAIGGGAQSTYWLKLIATVLNVTLERPRDGEFGAAMGAARLAVMARTGAASEDVLVKPEISEAIAPVQDVKDQFDAAYETFKAAYPKIKSAQSANRGTT